MTISVKLPSSVETYVQEDGRLTIDGLRWFQTIVRKLDDMERRLVGPTSGELTLATGAVTKTGSHHTIDTEAGAASDDLDTISGGLDGEELIIQAANSARSVVAKDGTGNLVLAGDFTIDNIEDTLKLYFNGTSWIELSRSNNGA